jgi:tetratricopeptide (TPR) repeat protein
MRLSPVFVAALLVVCTVSYAAESAKKPPELSPAKVEERFLGLLKEGKQAEAEELLSKYVRQYRDNQDVVFLYAACARSRFMVSEALPIFDVVADLGRDTPRGKCATYMLRLDTRRDVEENFASLSKLVDANPDDIVLRWMIAVQCRTLEKNEEGVTHYKKILEKWDPGPSLVHQTYGNLLDELHRYEEALVERRKTVKLEPAGWSYQGLGNTLTSMGRYQEANDAYRKCVELAPNHPEYWRCWGWSLLRQKDYVNAISRVEKAVALNPRDSKAYQYWGQCLENTGDKVGALDKYQKAVKLDPCNEYVLQRIEALTGESLGKGTKAAKPKP